MSSIINTGFVGNNNTAIGSSSNSNGTTGNNNTSVGFNALKGAVGNSATQCTAVGSGALVSNAGSFNTALGYNALGNNTTGIGNIAIGVSAMLSGTTGNNNTAIGNNSLSGITGGNFNICIGNNAGSGYTGVESNNILIGNTGIRGETGTIRIGATGQTSLFVPLYNITADVSNNVIPLTNFNQVRYNPTTTQLVQCIPTFITTSTVFSTLGTYTGNTANVTSQSQVFTDITLSAGTWLINYTISLNVTTGSVLLSAAGTLIYISGGGILGSAEFAKTYQTFSSDIIQVDNDYNSRPIGGSASCIVTLASTSTVNAYFRYKSTGGLGTSRWQLSNFGGGSWNYLNAYRLS